MSFVKPIFRVAVIGGLATVALVAVAGPERVKALAGQARGAVVSKIDENIQDPVLLRAQLRELEAKYPQRIAEVRGDLTEVQSQISELKRDKAVAEKVVEMARNDLMEVKGVLDRAEQARVESPASIIQVRIGEGTHSLDQAYGKATQINNTLNAYMSRAADAERDLTFLADQEKRLTDLLNQMEGERATFQAQVWQLDGQVEMIARNDRLIEMVEKRQKQLEKYDRFDAVSLDQITTRMNRIKAEQESRLQSLAASSKTENYEAKAKAMIDAEGAARSIFEKSLQLTPVKPTVLEIGPEGTSVRGGEGPVALRDTRPVVIE